MPLMVRVPSEYVHVRPVPQLPEAVSPDEVTANDSIATVKKTIVTKVFLFIIVHPLFKPFAAILDWAEQERLFQ